MTEENESFFSSSYQEAIFNLLFLLVGQYEQSMPKSQAVNKACDWLISLANEIKKKTIELDIASQEKNKLLKETRD